MTRCELSLLVGLLLVLNPGVPSGSGAPRHALAEAPKPAAGPGTPETPPATGPAARPVPTPAPAARARASRSKPAAADVVRVLRRINPSLSEQEAQQIGAAVLRHGARYGLDADLVLAVILVESGARPSVISPNGALGLMQVMPAHFERLGVEGDGTHIESNVQVGCSILARNIARHGEERGILAYYWGDDIRGDAYLGKIRAAQAKVRARLSS